uniref:Uncharacterized protein n=1 Tax=Mycena chlorophos TaxID=658473 RepID=A0ABQ0LJD7_MYCCL|nr:predicted protein [Mycena chlorophos]
MELGIRVFRELRQAQAAAEEFESVRGCVDGEHEGREQEHLSTADLSLSLLDPDFHHASPSIRPDATSASGCTLYISTNSLTRVAAKKRLRRLVQVLADANAERFSLVDAVPLNPSHESHARQPKLSYPSSSRPTGAAHALPLAIPTCCSLTVSFASKPSGRPQPNSVLFSLLTATHPLCLDHVQTTTNHFHQHTPATPRGSDITSHIANLRAPTTSTATRRFRQLLCVRRDLLSDDHRIVERRHYRHSRVRPCISGRPRWRSRSRRMSRIICSVARPICSVAKPARLVGQSRKCNRLLSIGHWDLGARCERASTLMMENMVRPAVLLGGGSFACTFSAKLGASPERGRHRLSLNRLMRGCPYM